MKHLRTNYFPAAGTVAGCLLGLASLDPSAQAQITHAVTPSGGTFVHTLTFSSESWGGYQFTPVLGDGAPENYLPAGSELLSVSVNATLDASSGGTWANDLTFYLGHPKFVSPGVVTAGFTDGPLQVGGSSPLTATYYTWTGGAIVTPGTTLVETKTQADFGSGIDVGSWTVYVGNGFGAGGVSGTWTGTIVFTVVPEPQEVAVMAAVGLIGFAMIRRHFRTKA